MNYRHLRSGIFIISIGVLFLLINFNIINGWAVLSTFLEFWPAIFIMIGINIIFRKNDIVRTVTWLIFLTALVSYSYFNGVTYNAGNNSRTSITNEKIEYKSGVERGNLKLDLGGTRLMVDSTNNNLLEGYVSDPNLERRDSYTDGGKTASIQYGRDHGFYFWPIGNHESSFSLNKDVIWNLDINTGAAEGILDMTDLKVENISINAGAVDIKLLFGSKTKSTYARIKAGASSFDVTVPKDAGARVRLDGALTGNNLRELGWSRQGKEYISPNYNSSQNKIDIDVSMGVGSFTVNVR